MPTLYEGQNVNFAFRIVTLQKSHQNYKSAQEQSLEFIIFKKGNILKLEDKILINNIIFILIIKSNQISKSINNLQPPIFKNWLIFCSDIHKYDTVSSSTDKLLKSSYRTDSYGRSSVIIGAINCWNKMQNILMNQSLKSLNPNKIKTILTKRCIDKYL